MLAIAAVLLFAIQDPAAPPAAESRRQVAAPREMLELSEGRRLVGPVLKETAEALFVDLGFDVVRVPLSAIVRRVRDEAQGSGRVFDESVFFQAERPEQPIPEGAAEVGEAVVKIESPAGQGSGFITSPDGYCVTNFHVVEKELDVDVTLYLRSKNGFDLKTLRKVKVIAANPQIDLALIKIDPGKDLRLKHVFLGDSNKVKVGEQVYAIGTPVGLERTVSSGIVSVTNRTWGGHLMFQITTPINPGNSGGPLFNLRAEVIGVNSAGYRGLQGLNFAIPSRYVIDFLRNREAFAIDASRPENGIHYLPAPRKRGS
jgi:serine protease Do